MEAANNIKRLTNLDRQSMGWQDCENSSNQGHRVALGYSYATKDATSDRPSCEAKAKCSNDLADRNLSKPDIC